jgi:hypothetical protein
MTYCDSNLSQCEFVHHKSHRGWFGIEHRHSRWETCATNLLNRGRARAFDLYKLKSVKKMANWIVDYVRVWKRSMMLWGCEVWIYGGMVVSGCGGMEYEVMGVRSVIFQSVGMLLLRCCYILTIYISCQCMGQVFRKQEGHLWTLFTAWQRSSDFCWLTTLNDFPLQLWWPQNADLSDRMSRH